MNHENMGWGYLTDPDPALVWVAGIPPSNRRSVRILLKGLFPHTNGETGLRELPKNGFHIHRTWSDGKPQIIAVPGENFRDGCLLTGVIIGRGHLRVEWSGTSTSAILLEELTSEWGDEKEFHRSFAAILAPGQSVTYRKLNKGTDGNFHEYFDRYTYAEGRIQRNIHDYVAWKKLLESWNHTEVLT